MKVGEAEEGGEGRETRQDLRWESVEYACWSQSHFCRRSGLLSVQVFTWRLPTDAWEARLREGEKRGMRYFRDQGKSVRKEARRVGVRK